VTSDFGLGRSRGSDCKHREARRTNSVPSSSENCPSKHESVRLWRFLSLIRSRAWKNCEICQMCNKIKVNTECLTLAQIKNYAALSPVEVLILHMTRKKCKHKLLVMWMFKEAVDLYIHCHFSALYSQIFIFLILCFGEDGEYRLSTIFWEYINSTIQQGILTKVCVIFVKEGNLHGLGECVFHWEGRVKGFQSYKLRSLE
jgi:hypothetical protein